MPLTNGVVVRELVDRALIKNARLNITGISGDRGTVDQPFGFSARQLSRACKGAYLSYSVISAIAKRLEGLLGEAVEVEDLVQRNDGESDKIDVRRNASATAKSIGNEPVLNAEEGANISISFGQNTTRGGIESNKLVGDGTDHENSGIYEVLFGTNRVLEPLTKETMKYGSERADSLSYGFCQVFVPKSHRIGSVGSNALMRLFRGDDRLKVVKQILLSRSDFQMRIRELLQDDEVFKKPTLFVHGFNNSFEDAVLRAAQIGRDLGLTGGIGLYSWPSHGKLTKYVADESAMEVSKFFLAEFIENFVLQFVDERLNIIAHSMGCRCLLLAIEELVAQNSPALQKIGHIIFAAADVDQDMMQRLGAYAAKHAKRATNYASSRDTAVQISTWLHSFPRVGICPPVFVMDGVDTVLVNNTDLTIIGHGYVADNSRVLSDIHQLLTFDADPKDRFTLKDVKMEMASHWKLKD